jgi:adenylate kinase family enzyme
MKTVIFGNSGSGKTWLAKNIGEKWNSPVIHLDEIFWLPGGFNVKRSPTEVEVLVEAKRLTGEWVVEGVYGKLARQFMQSASAIVWLDMPWEVCKRRLRSRGSESKVHMGREQSQKGCQELVEWATDPGGRL